MITSTPGAASTLKADLNLGYIWLISAVAAMGGLLFGWDWVSRHSWFGQSGWRWMFGLTAAPSVLFFILERKMMNHRMHGMH